MNTDHSTFRKELSKIALNILNANGHRPWRVEAFLFGSHDDPICARDSEFLISIIDTWDKFHAWNLTLPARIIETNLFPHEKMLKFMEVETASLPKKKAKPRDWIQRVESFAAKVRDEYNATHPNPRTTESTPARLRGGI